MRKVGAKSVCFNMRRLSCEQTVDRLLDQCPKAVASKQLCCGCLECCHLVHIWFPSFLKSPTLFHDHDLILKIPFFFSLLPAKGPVINLLQQPEHGKTLSGDRSSFPLDAKVGFCILCYEATRKKNILTALMTYDCFLLLLTENTFSVLLGIFTQHVNIINMDLIEALLILPLTRCPTVSLGINFLKEKALTDI